MRPSQWFTLGAEIGGMKAEDIGAMLREYVRAATDAGAHDAVACYHGGVSEEVAVREGRTESMVRSVTESVGLKIFYGEACAEALTEDVSRSPASLAADVLAAARAAPPDPFAGLPAREELSDVRMDDAPECEAPLPTPDQLTAYALKAEAAARAVLGITGGDGAEAGADRRCFAMARADGAFFWRARAGASASVSVRAGSEASGGMERDYAWRAGRAFAALPVPALLGAEAGQRAARRLGAAVPPSGRYDVVFEPRMARTLLGCFVQAANGAAAARGGSFLCGKLGTRVFPAGITVECDPLLPEGLSSALFDAEGLPCRRLVLAEDGIFREWLLDGRSARRMGMRSNGCAQGGTSPQPGARNAAILPGKASPEDLIRGVVRGIYITDTFGGGVNEVTGDFSRGMSGLLIEHGTITTPVNAFTVAGTLPDMFARLQAASDLARVYGLDSPTLLIEDMAVAGS